MPTAPTFSTYKVVSTQPFMKNGKQYITVEHPTTHNHRDVRLYSDIEYAKLYGKPASHHEPDGRKHIPNLRKIRGFSNGPILVICGALPSHEDWLNRSCARYATNVGWYIASTDFLPSDTPSDLALVPLTFDEFSESEDLIREDKELTRIINSKLRTGKCFSPSFLLGKEEARF